MVDLSKTPEDENSGSDDEWAAYQETQVGMPIADPNAAAPNPDPQAFAETAFSQQPPDDQLPPAYLQPPAQHVSGPNMYGPPGYTPNPYGPNPYGPNPYAPNQYAPPAAPMYGGPGMYAPPPSRSEGSTIGALVVSILLLFGCYTALVGIAPLVLSIMSFSKGNSVSSLWMAGQYDLARHNAAEADRLARWAWISLGIGVAVVVVAVLVFVVIATVMSR